MTSFSPILYGDARPHSVKRVADWKRFPWKSVQRVNCKYEKKSTKYNYDIFCCCFIQNINFI